MINTTIEIKLCVQNLGKYNEGELVFEWLTLPATQEEIQDTLKAIGIDGVNYEEYMIADYETSLDLEIGEYDNIEKWNEIAETLENEKDETVRVAIALYNDYVNDLQDAIYKAKNEVVVYGNCSEVWEVAHEYYTQETDYLDNLPDDLKHSINWESVADFLENDWDLLKVDDNTYVRVLF